MTANKWLWIILTFLAGAILPIQAGFNSRMGRAAENPVFGAASSFVVGTLALILYLVISQQAVSWTGVKSAPAFSWLGGLLGAFYVTVIILAFPKLGPGLTFGLVVAGQMIISIVLQHINVLVAEPSSINIWKILGIVLIIAGVIVIRK